MDRSEDAGQPRFAPLEFEGRNGIERIPVLGELPSLPADSFDESNESLPPAPEPVPRARRVLLPVVLFFVTCLSTFWAGCTGWFPGAPLLNPEFTAAAVKANWLQGLAYMAGVMGILLAHEMGHFVQALRYHIPASLPFFIPMPITPIGTMGAVIGMHGSRADRKQMFDIGISGPLAGLVVAIPLLIVGILRAHADLASKGEIEFGDPLLVKALLKVLRPDVGPDEAIFLNPMLMAAWVGLLITGLNMLPISQLDGGHVAYALLGKRAHWLARGIVLLAMLFIVVFEQYGWTVMLMLVMLIGTDHPPTRDDRVPLGRGRIALGWLSLLIPVFCLKPIPISFK